VVTPRPRNETLFIGMFLVRNVKRAAAGRGRRRGQNDPDELHPYVAQIMADPEVQAEVEERFLKPLRKARRWARLRGVRTKKIDRG
jgi:hypothetical protein